MRSLGLGLALLLLAVPAVAQSSVWKVTKGEHVLFLGGTCHVLRAQDFPLPPEFDLAYAASAAVYFESDIERMQSPEMQRIVLREGTYQDGRTLEQALTPESWQAVQTYWRQTGLPIAHVQSLKPWVFTIMMTMMELQKLGVSMEGVDMVYHQRAKADGRTVGALETFEQQIAFLTGLGAGHESELIVKTLQDLAEMPAKVESMLAAWRSGDVRQLDATVLEDVRRDHPTIYHELFVERNEAWLPKLEELLTTAEIEYVLVGAGHLAGLEGLLAQLSARGYGIEQLVAPAPQPK